MALWRLPGHVGGEPDQPVPRDVVAVMVAMGDGSAGATGSTRQELPHWSVGFWIDGVHAAAERATKLGGKVVVPPHEVPGFRSAVLADPAGAAFSLSEKLAG
jgi:predicted enzyme related to lactoylglutathione lyase